MSRVVLMCGPAGSGKSTYARELERAGMVRLSFDTVAFARGLTMPLASDVHASIEAELRERLVGLVAERRDVVVDFAFATRAMRDDYRALLAPAGIVPEVVYLAADRETALARVRARRGTHSDDAVLTDELAARYFDLFEPPTPEEGPLTVLR